jgi:hypothetical protein
VESPGERYSRSVPHLRMISIADVQERAGEWGLREDVVICDLANLGRRRATL